MSWIVLTAVRCNENDCDLLVQQFMVDLSYAARFSSSEKSHPRGVTEGLRF